MMTNRTKRELLNLVEALCEETASIENISRLEELVLSHPDGLRLYVEAITLHGLLHWDAAGIGSFNEEMFSSASSSVSTSASHFSRGDSESFSSNRTTELIAKLEDDLQQGRQSRLSFRRRMTAGLASLAALMLLAFGLFLFLPQNEDQLASAPQPANAILSDLDQKLPARNSEIIPDVHLPSIAETAVGRGQDSGADDPAQSSESASVKTMASRAASSPSVQSLPTIDLSSDEAIVARINERLQIRWQAAQVTPAAQADDAEWVRRVYLDLVGRIPTSREAETFFEQSNPNKRQALVDSLLKRHGFPRHLATIWTNLLVGRSRDRKIDREALSTWLEEEFTANRSWRETVTQLIAARGSLEESGPANFLLAHLNNQAVPATAITSRIFLCEQLQCTQCHVHPTVKSWGQDRFWEMNAFFQQARIEETRVVDAASGQKRNVRTLVDAEDFGPTYYETLRGVMHVAFPKFAGVEITPSMANSQFPLRDQLAELLFAEERPQPARAFVNRTWSQLMGYGFTNPVDDMGPHTPISHPELLEDLTAAFVESGYDVHRLYRWICLSQAYQLSSQKSEQNSLDAPELGEKPLFSRMYVKRLSAEQLFDSLRIAGGLSPRQVASEASLLQREDWLRQFYSAVDTEENGEISTFDGSLPQALMMMNGELVEQALSPRNGHVLAEISTRNGTTEAERIRQLSLAALARYPTHDELTEIRKLLRKSVRQRTANDSLPPQLALVEGLKDVYWAYLNSSEFAVNH